LWAHCAGDDQPVFEVVLAMPWGAQATRSDGVVDPRQAFVKPRAQKLPFRHRRWIIVREQFEYRLGDVAFHQDLTSCTRLTSVGSVCVEDGAAGT
jgi:hypothetical protein